MIKNFEDMQKLGQTNVDSAMRMFGEWNKNWQAIAAEMSDYTKRSDTGLPRVSTFLIDKRRELNKKEKDQRKRNPNSAQVLSLKASRPV